jgi:protein-tyrosine phosphatase
MARAGAGRAVSIRMMREFDAGADSPDVPDPYYGGEAGFEDMYAILTPACAGLLESLST